ncbi:MAG: hypothetical protein ABSF26_30665 [Thermoguttaceae bacterium]|jgi:hypothetical protein
MTTVVNQNPRIESVRDFLAHTLPGPISDPKPLLCLLEACWHGFWGSELQAMAPYKLRRMERVAWNPPILKFVVERHGGTMMGSSRAELQQWTVNLDTLTAGCQEIGHRQMSPMQPRLDVGQLADEIAGLIVSRADDARLKWGDDGTDRVLIGKIIPADSAVRQTPEGRRRRFGIALFGLLAGRGWRVVRPNVYGRCNGA